ncbi:MAG: aldo/keto reductase, partial [Deltaproteobacteria bacterium]|nr:aldo/keto reductase [Nannocystaceae bacterium]
GLSVSPIGFGGRGIRDDDALHRRALGMALDGGVNLIDTSSNYGDGRSETLVGIALAHAVQQGSLRREQVVVVTKLGYLQGNDLARARARVQSFEDMVVVDEGCWHCIHPTFLREQLADSLVRLGLARIDVVLLHDPECFLAHDRVHADGAARRGAYDDRLRRAFACLEQLADAGAIGWYGVSSNGLSLPEHDLRYTSTQRLVELAHEVGGDGHRFGVVELPMNLLELGAATLQHPSEGGRTALQVAGAADLGVLVNRPLAAMHAGAPLRLADVEIDEHGIAEALAVVRKLEGAWADDLGRRILTDEGGDNAIDLFRWGRELSRVWRELGDRERWRSLRHEIIAPQLGHASAALLTHLSGDDREDFARWWQSYGTAMHHAFTAIEAWLERPPAATVAISEAIDPLLPTPWRELPLSRKAVLVALSAPIACVLVGMRQPGWVADMLALREHPVRLLSAATGPVAHAELQARLSRLLAR